MGFGTILKDILADKNMSIKELSEVTGIPLNTLYSITKRDNVKVRQETLEKISKAINVPTKELVHRLRCDIANTEKQLQVLQYRLHEAEIQREEDKKQRFQIAQSLKHLTNYNFSEEEIDLIIATAVLLKEPSTTE